MLPRALPAIQHPHPARTAHSRQVDRKGGKGHFALKSLSKMRMDYAQSEKEERGGLEVSLGSRSTLTLGQKTEYRIQKMRRDKSQELLAEAKKINNKHYNFRLKHRQSSEGAACLPAKENMPPWSKTSWAQLASAAGEVEPLRRLKYQSFRSKWFLDLQKSA